MIEILYACRWTILKMIKCNWLQQYEEAHARNIMWNVLLVFLRGSDRVKYFTIHEHKIANTHQIQLNIHKRNDIKWFPNSTTIIMCLWYWKTKNECKTSSLYGCSCIYIKWCHTGETHMFKSQLRHPTAPLHNQVIMVHHTLHSAYVLNTCLNVCTHPVH